MQIQVEKEQLDPQLLVQLVERLRPEDATNTAEIQKKIQGFIHTLLLTPTSAEIIQRFVLRLLNQYKQVSLYAESGILSSEGFATQLSHRIGAHFLPLLEDDSELKD